MPYNMLFAAFDWTTTLTNSGLGAFALWVLYKILRQQMATFRIELATERERADAAMIAERSRADAAMIAERQRAADHLLDERKVWTGAVRQITARQSSMTAAMASLDSTVKQHLDKSQANNGHSNGQ
jgi:hypothetical protein